MSFRLKIVISSLVTIFCAAGCATAETTISTAAADGAMVYGETYYGELGSDAPMIALFHLAGGDGRGEYEPLSSWLNEIGYRAIAWDQRSGGARFGSDNRTASAYAEDPGYCAAYQDLAAALGYSIEAANGAPVIVWGSSYSAALVFRLAADYPSEVAAVISASPASGPPMTGCDLESVIGSVSAPVLVLRPQREYEATKEQADFLMAAGVDFRIVENGVHGSSMLSDARTQQDMAAERAFVASWLQSKLNGEE